MPGVSVIIPTFSRPRLLARAVESARTAASAHPEIVVVDDASTDETADVCRTLSGVKYVRLERNLGVAGARNVGLLASTREYVAFLDDDDLRLPGSLDLQVAALEANPAAGFCCGPVLFADADGRRTGEVGAARADAVPSVFWSLLRMDFFIQPVGVVVRRSAILAAGLLRPRVNGIDDWDLWVRLAELFPVVTVPEPVGVYRRPTPGSGQGSADFARDAPRLFRHQKELLRLPLAASAAPGERRRVRRETARRLADVLLHRAAVWGPRGHYRFALEHLLTGLRLAPSRALRPFVYRELYASLRERGGAAGEGGAARGRDAFVVGRDGPETGHVEPGRAERVTGAGVGETVSVIIATHDRPRLVPRAIESALAAGRDVEVVVVDDASPTDETEEVCRRYEGVRYFRAARNQRLGGARNIGVALSRGAFITFLDDDDTRLPGSLDEQRRMLVADPHAVMVYGQATLEWAAGDTGPEKYPLECPEGDVFWELMERNFVPVPAAMFRREMLFRVGLPQDTTPGEDWDCWLRIAEVGRVLAQPRPVATYRKGNPRSGQVTSGAAYMVETLTGIYRRRWQGLERARADDARRRRAWRAFSYNMATHLVWEAGRALRHGRFGAAARNVWTALRLHPLATLRRAVTPSNARFVKRALVKLLG
ncbi:MAG TPA: glycosyltransferase family 2 protein [Pyrinomonadaceae bacterium]|jgi:glycosyltransferase involved in cell wall biosynthesis